MFSRKRVVSYAVIQPTSLHWMETLFGCFICLPCLEDMKGGLAQLTDNATISGQLAFTLCTDRIWRWPPFV